MSTETTERASFLGITIKGDINKQHRTDQWPADKFAPIVQAMLDDEKVVEFGWKQYTPYFNDGDPCHFSAYGAWVQLEGDDVEYRGDLAIDERNDLGTIPRTWSGNDRIERPYEGPDEARYRRCHALADAVDDGHFNDVLLDLFGDHAEVTVRRDGIKVDSYQHD